MTIKRLYIGLLFLLGLSILPLSAATAPTYTTFRANICQGEHLQINGHEILETGIYYDTLKNKSGKDSILQYIVNVYPSYHFYDTLAATVAQQPITWQGRKINTSGTYEAAYKTQHECDSVYHLYVRFFATHLIQFDTTVCQSELPVEWRGRKYYQPGIYSDPLQTIDHTDSVYQMNLTVLPNYTFHRTIDLCEGSSITYKGKEYTTGGTIVDSLLTYQGCDSIELIHIRTHSGFVGTDHAGLNDGSTYTWARNGETYSEPGNYEYRSYTINGCDSIWYLHLERNPSYHYVEKEDFCQTAELSYYAWRGKHYTVSGTYYDSLITKLGQDSIYQLDLQVHPYYKYTQAFNICDNGTVIFGGHEISSDTIITDSLKTAFGCDSVVTTIVRVNQSFHHYDTITISNQETLQWHGQTITQSGNYFDYKTSVITGCDSIYQLRVYVYPVYIYTTDTAICQTEVPYIWRGHECSLLGTHTYEDRYTTVHGYDSIYRLNLTVNPAYSFDHTISLCPGSSEEFRGVIYDQAGEYTQVLRTGAGCDSICHVHVSVLEGYFFREYASINDGESYYWPRNGETYTQPGTYELKEKTQDGCDSIYMLSITRNVRYFFPETVVTCALDTLPYYIWRDHQLSESGVYYDSLYTIAGQDSIYQLNLTIAERYDKYEYRELCREGDSFLWHQWTIDKPGEYVDSMRTYLGCDSICHLIVNFNRYEIQLYDTICDGDTIYWQNYTITRGDTLYTRRLSGINDCDSILKLQVTMYHPFMSDGYDTICESQLLAGEHYLWGPNQSPLRLNQDANGHYQDSTFTSCDGLHFFHLHVLRERIGMDSITICDGDSVERILHDGSSRWFTKAGRYYDTIPAYGQSQRYSCDSIVCYFVQVYSRPNDTIVHHVSDKKLPYIWKTYSITETGYYADTMTMTTSGCDSITVLHLIVDTTYFFEDSIKICRPHYHGENHPLNTPYIWEGHRRPGKNNYEIFTAGIYYDSLRTTITNVDSIYKLKVDTFPIYHFKYTTDMCAGDSIYVGGAWQTKGGTYRDTLRTVDGCDSIIQLTINQLNSYLISQTVNISEKETYTWNLSDTQGNAHSHVLSTPGVYYDTLKSVRACDSIIALHLNVHPLYDQHDTVVICQSELPYIWAGHHGNQNIYEGGVYYDTLQTVAGYDSTFVLDLTILPSYKTRVLFSTCAGDSIQYNRTWYKKPGIYTDTLLTRDGCDSVITIQFEWRQKYYIERPPVVKDDKTPYVWTEGHITRTLTHSGMYYDTLQASTGCDSIIALRLTVYPTYSFDENVIICQSETPYEWHNKQYWTTGDYVDSMQTVAHYDSIFHLHLTVRDTAYVDYQASICRGESFVYNGKTYSKGGVYLDTLKTNQGCDSIVIIRVQERPDYLISDTAAVANREPYLWRGQILTHTGIYYDRLSSTVTGCDSVYELVLTVYDKEQFRETTIRVCQNELPYRWKDKWLSETQVFYDTITTGDVDTIWRVDFRVNKMEYESIEKILCAGDIYTFNGKTYTRDTLVHDTIFSGAGCGKEYTLYLHFRNPRYIHLNAKTSSDKPYRWAVEDSVYRYRFSGDYEHIVRTKDGQCDSLIYTLHLSVGQVYNFRDSLTLCQNELPYIWHNQMIYEAGTYYDSLQTVLHYDSVYTLKVLAILPSYFAEQAIDLCAGAGTFHFRGKEYSENGTFYDTIPTINGCDSIYKINVRVHPSYKLYDTVHISDKDTYDFDGRTLTKSGTYEGLYKTHESGCDSIVYLTLYVHPSYLFEREESICEKDTFLWRGKKLYKEGFYYDSLLTKQGYDSVYHLNLQVNKTYFIQEAVEVCPNRTTFLHGIDISQPGVYLDTLHTTCCGCDSVYQITVNWTRSFKQEYSDTICQGEKYNFYGVNYTKSGTYKYEIGCDSTIILHLKVLERDFVEQRVVISEEDLPYHYKGEEYYQSGTYRDTLTNQNGCDSIIILTLIASEHASAWDQIPLCPGSEIRIDTMVITKSGLYTFLRRSQVSGKMDSLYRVQVYDAPAYDLPAAVVSICQGDTLTYCGQKFWYTGHYDFNLKTKEGCDSLMHLDLTVNPTYQFYTDAVIADYQTYKWNGSEYNLTGNYDRTWLSRQGCDSTYTLRLNVVPTKYETTIDTICYGQHYNWRGKTIDVEGTYTDTLLSLPTTSTIYTLQLTTLHPTLITGATVSEVCADEENLNIAFTFSGDAPTHYSIYFDQLAKNEGFRDVINQPFLQDNIAQASIPQKREVVYLEHTAYVRPDYYSMRLALDNGVCGISRSDSLVFLVKYPSWIIEQNWGDVVAPLKPELNGGYSFAQTDWYVNGALQANNGLGYLYNKALHEGDEVIMMAKRKGDSYAIPSCPLIIQRAPAPVNTTPILVYPTSVPKHAPMITVDAQQGGSYEVYSSTGMLVTDGKLANGQTQVQLPSVSGIYFIRTTHNDEIQTHKVLLY